MGSWLELVSFSEWMVFYFYFYSILDHITRHNKTWLTAHSRKAPWTPNIFTLLLPCPCTLPDVAHLFQHEQYPPSLLQAPTCDLEVLDPTAGLHAHGGYAALDQPARVRQQLVDWLVGWLVERVGSSATQFMSHQSAMINKRAHQYVKRTKSLNGENTTIDLNRSVAPSV